MVKLKSRQASSLDKIDITVESKFFLNSFRVGAAATKTFVLLLANNSPKSLLSGKNIELDKVLQRYNRSEFHHIYPRAFLRDSGFEDVFINVLGNFCFLSAAENKSIGRKKPSVYVNELVGEDNGRAVALATAFCVVEQFNDEYQSFLQLRCERLAKFASSLIA
jgi:hypothetical protein